MRAISCKVLEEVTPVKRIELNTPLNRAELKRNNRSTSGKIWLTQCKISPELKTLEYADEPRVKPTHPSSHQLHSGEILLGC